jgi:hypothetical protein
MSASADLQSAICNLLRAPGALRVNVPVLDRITGDQENDILAAAEKQTGLVVYVMPVVPKRADSMQGGDVVFFDAAEVIVRVIEQPRVNNAGAGASAFDLMDDIIRALHWHGIPGDGSDLGRILSHPLQLAPVPVEIREGVIEESKELLRILDVIFNATYGFAGN